MSIQEHFRSKNYSLIEFDYAQLEIRVLALASQDPNLIRDINEGRDMHTYFASQIFNAPESSITKEQRKMAKGFSFQLQYGAGAKSIADHWNVDVELAKKFIKTYYHRYHRVDFWQQEVLRQAESTMDYRGDIDKETNESIPSCFIPSIWKDKDTGKPVTTYKVLADKPPWSSRYVPPATRCKNFPIQGAASDIVMLMMHRFFKKCDDGMVLINSVHDSFLVLCLNSMLGECARNGVSILSEVPNVLKNSFFVDSPVEFPVDYSIGSTLQEVKSKG